MVPDPAGGTGRSPVAPVGQNPAKLSSPLFGSPVVLAPWPVVLVVLFTAVFKPPTISLSAFSLPHPPDPFFFPLLAAAAAAPFPDVPFPPAFSLNLQGGLSPGHGGLAGSLCGLQVLWDCVDLALLLSDARYTLNSPDLSMYLLLDRFLILLSLPLVYSWF